MINAWLHGIVYVGGVAVLFTTVVLIGTWVETWSAKTKNWVVSAIMLIIIFVVVPLMIGYSSV